MARTSSQPKWGEPKRCSICGEKKPATTENFYLVNPKANDGRLRPQCIPCYKADKEAKRQKRKQKKIPVAQLPNLIVINEKTGTYALYEPVKHVPARTAQAAQKVGQFMKDRGWLVVEKTS